MAFEYLEQYSTFDSVDEMDEHVELHLKKHDLTESERAIVRKIARHALDYPGASHLKAIVIADALKISTKTVYRAVKKLVELGIIKKVHTVRQKMSGRGANIYVILPCEIQVAETPQEPTAYMNEWQQMLYDFMQSLPLPSAIHDELHKVVLASQVQNVKEFINAKNVIFNIASDVANGTLTVTKSLRALFIGAYKAAVTRKQDKPSTTMTVEEKPVASRPVPFYNWLTERENRCPEFVIPKQNTLENWLEWG